MVGVRGRRRIRVKIRIRVGLCLRYKGGHMWLGWTRVVEDDFILSVRVYISGQDQGGHLGMPREQRDSRGKHPLCLFNTLTVHLQHPQGVQEKAHPVFDFSIAFEAQFNATSKNACREGIAYVRRYSICRLQGIIILRGYMICRENVICREGIH